MKSDCYIFSNGKLEDRVKGNLQEAGIAFPKTYDLVILLDLSLPIAPQLDSFRSRLRLLSLAAVEIRYPGRSADQEMAEEFYQLCIEMRDAIRSALGV
jgi:HEPN domain